MKFVDYVTITVRSGKGGAGAVSFRREPHVPQGGPNGGNGGKGGSVILEADHHLYTLLDLRYNRHHFADKGQNGSSNLKTGKDGQDMTLRVPCGTVAKDTDTGEALGEVMHPGDRLVLVRGGRGGKGNDHFKTATNRTPRYAQPGEEGEERNVTLELKVLADVGLVGFPNAGKSTLISALSAARPKIADYPFTTLEPNLGVVAYREYKSFVMADIPGIIEGAHEGRGLGLRFLKHIERNAVLLFMIPVDTTDIAHAYTILLDEIEAFNSELLEKPRMLALTKIDLLSVDERAALPQRIQKLPLELPVFTISAVAHQGLDSLKDALWMAIQTAKGV
ncbi:MAG: GTPase ObgE [Bacteroidetes Order II. Incertae sedis bacterium]|nr:GTPase ObgE [Bacteroidetes Order II. bacterium]